MGPDLDTATTAAETTRPRGRPRQFDRDDVLDRVVQLFWEQGFEFTSVADIVATTGLNKSSLYNTFGSKEQLFTAALDRYLATRTATLTRLLLEGDAGLADIGQMLEFMRDDSAGTDGFRGCLAVNTSTELGNRDDTVVRFSQRYRDTIRDALRAALDRAETRGEIAVGTAGRRASILLSFVLSLAVMTRGGAGEPEIEAQFSAIEALLDEWQQ